MLLTSTALVLAACGDDSSTSASPSSNLLPGLLCDVIPISANGTSTTVPSGDCAALSVEANTTYTIKNEVSPSNAYIYFEDTSVRHNWGFLSGGDSVVVQASDARKIYIRFSTNGAVSATTGGSKLTDYGEITSFSTTATHRHGQQLAVNLNTLLGSNLPTASPTLAFELTDFANTASITNGAQTLNIQTTGKTSLPIGDLKLQPRIYSASGNNYVTAYTSLNNGFYLEHHVPGGTSNSATYIGMTTLPVQTVTASAAQPVACNPPTITGTPTLPTSFSASSNFDVTIPWSGGTGDWDVTAYMSQENPVLGVASTSFNATQVNTAGGTSTSVNMTASSVLNIDTYKLSTIKFVGSGATSCTALYYLNSNSTVYELHQTDTIAVQQYQTTTSTPKVTSNAVP